MSESPVLGSYSYSSASGFRIGGIHWVPEYEYEYEYEIGSELGR
jgi:hypothetical protein